MSETDFRTHPIPMPTSPEPQLRRRTLLSGAVLAGVTGNVAIAAASPSASAAPETLDILSARSFGAIGDGRLHSLAERFATLEAARATYPDAKALTDSIDGCAIQRALDAASQKGIALQAHAAVHLPAGRYRLSRSLRLPSNIRFFGDGIAVSIIDNQNTPLAEPLIVNANPSVAAMFLRDLSLHGGTHGVKIDVREYVDGYDFTRVSFQMQRDANFSCNRLLQVGAFTGCIFAKAPIGIDVAGWTTNLANFYDCRFEDHARISLRLNSAECINFFGGRFEGGGNPHGDTATIELIQAAAVNFIGVYFEGTQPVLLRERRSRDGVTFSGCHFTGSANPGGPPGAYRFDSDGIVNFGPNDWGTAAQGPARMALHGVNRGLGAGGRRYFAHGSGHWHITSEPIALSPRQAKRILVVGLAAISAGPSLAAITGTVEATFLARGPTGSAQVSSTAYRLVGTTDGKRVTSLKVSPVESGVSLFQIRTEIDGNRAIATITVDSAFAGTLRLTVIATQTGDAAPAFELDIG